MCNAPLEWQAKGIRALYSQPLPVRRTLHTPFGRELVPNTVMWKYPVSHLNTHNITHSIGARIAISSAIYICYNMSLLMLYPLPLLCLMCTEAIHA